MRCFFWHYVRIFARYAHLLITVNTQIRRLKRTNDALASVLERHLPKGDSDRMADFSNLSSAANRLTEEVTHDGLLKTDAAVLIADLADNVPPPPVEDPAIQAAVDAAASKVQSEVDRLAAQNDALEATLDAYSEPEPAP